jgi:hypothetical protein
MEEWVTLLALRGSSVAGKVANESWLVLLLVVAAWTSIGVFVRGPLVNVLIRHLELVVGV